MQYGLKMPIYTATLSTKKQLQNDQHFIYSNNQQFQLRERYFPFSIQYTIHFHVRRKCCFHLWWVKSQIYLFFFSSSVKMEIAGCEHEKANLQITRSWWCPLDMQVANGRQEVTFPHTTQYHRFSKRLLFSAVKTNHHKKHTFHSMLYAT